VNRSTDRESPGHDPSSPAASRLSGSLQAGLARPWPAIESSASRACAFTLIALGALVRLLYVFHHRINADESQHLHVAWAWTRGLLPYRDVFDNHSPLFSMLMAPLVALVGERADVVMIMRLAMIPIVAAAMAALWVISRRLYGATTAAWAVAIAAIFPDYLRGSVEYRTDQLWSTLWLWSLVALVGGPLSVARSFVTGLLVGTALATSMKTLATGTGLAMALIAVALVSSWRPSLRWIAPRFTAAIAGALVVPALLVAYFASRGALAAMHDQTISFNVVPGLGLWSSAPWRGWLFVPCVALCVWLAHRVVRGAPGLGTGRRRAAVLLGGGLYWAVVETLWPLVTRENLLPVYPVAALALAVIALALGDRAARSTPDPGIGRLAAIGVPAVVVVALITTLVSWEPPWRDGTVTQREVLAQVLRLTHPGELVMDTRYESVFRSRPSRLLLEQITAYRLATGSMADDIEQRMIATATPVVRDDLGFFPEAVQRFIVANYLPVGQWRAAGLRLDRAERPDGPRPFPLQIPGRYAVVTARGPARGTLDGSPIRESSFLAAGPHVYLPAPGEGTAFLLWAAAVERGFVPVALREERP
jgi:hypothetical protein